MKRFNKISFRKIRLYLRLIAEAMSRRFSVILPLLVLRFIGSYGWTQWIPRIQKLQFVGRNYGGNFQINVRADYAVERIAASRFLDVSDVVVGLKELQLANMVGLDIGANVGSISMMFVELGVAKVYAIEPGPLNQRLLENVKLNSLSDHISCHKLGISEGGGNLLWAEDKNNPGNAHLLVDKKSLDLQNLNTRFSAPEMVSVPTVTLDDFVSKHVKSGRVDLIKIDVEGMEWQVVKGGKRVISVNKPIVVAETHRGSSDMMGYDCITPMFQFFYDLEYRSFKVNQDGRLEEFIYPNFSSDTFFLPSKIYSENDSLV